MPNEKTARENGDTRQDCDRHIRQGHHRCHFRQVFAFANVGAVGDHAAQPEAHREKRLAHRLEDRRAGNLAEIGTQQEAYPFARAGQRQGVDGQRGRAGTIKTGWKILV